MRANYFLLLNFVLVVALETSQQQDTECSPWKHYNNETKACECGDDLLGKVKCRDQDDFVHIRSCYCLTADDEHEPVMSFCLYGCRYAVLEYHQLQTNTTLELNNATCGPYNRAGLLCGECVEGYARPVYSYSLSCVQCSSYKYNWIKYITVAYVPVTLFYCLIIIFRISATSGLMVGYVTVSQMMAIYNVIQIYLAIYKGNLIIETLLMLYSIWNLDFFRSLYPPFCLHPNLSALQVLSLDYVVAVYPMLLVLITYAFVKLHDHFAIVVWLFRPVYFCLHYIRKEWTIKTSLIEAFATLLLLSYAKILNVSFNIMTPTYSYYMNKSQGPLHVYDTNTLYLSRSHLPYFILAVLMTSVFNLFPLLLLCLYPCRCFQRCLHHSRLQNHALRTFMDTFQGCYKHKPCDLRYFSAVFLLLQILNSMIYVLLNAQHYHPAVTYVLVLVLTLISFVKPFRNKWHNAVTVFLFLVILFTFLSVVIGIEVYVMSDMHFQDAANMMGTLVFGFIFIPPLFGLSLAIRSIVPVKMKNVFIKSKRVYKLEASLPYRLQEDNDENTRLVGT